MPGVYLQQRHQLVWVYNWRISYTSHDNSESLRRTRLTVRSDGTQKLPLGLSPLPRVFKRKPLFARRPTFQPSTLIIFRNFLLLELAHTQTR